ncbi:MAG: hypothetical protein HN350_03915 [Phycisphaerales bacterium]|nr:hypothetical protein [Phycisphaerales bacterium]
MSKNTNKTTQNCENSTQRKKIIEIACPHQQREIRGLYPCSPDGQYIMLPDGAFNLTLIECSQDHGRCAETLCALHRFNRLGPGTWYPDTLRAVRENKQTRQQSPDKAGGKGNTGRDKTSFDQLC